MAAPGQVRLGVVTPRPRGAAGALGVLTMTSECTSGPSALRGTGTGYQVTGRDFRPKTTP
jgi:hypothetical protein